MTWWQALLLGAVQGLAEFLPISSSGHLAILQRLFGLNPEGLLFFDTVLHLGTLTAVCSVFFSEIISLFKRPYKRLWLLILATLPAGAVGLVFSLSGVIDKALSGEYAGFLLAAFFLVTAAVLYGAELYARRTRAKKPPGLRTAIYMGLAQAVAVLPGISRSGSTIAAGAFAGGDGEEVSRFSFLMSVPIIACSFLLELIKLIAGGGVHSFPSPSGTGVCLALGFISSAVFGLISVRLTLRAIKKADYKWFSLYLIILSAVCIALASCGYL